MSTMSAIKWQGDDLLLVLQLQPKARSNEFTGLVAGPQGDALRLRITAPPVEGKANKQLIQFLARAFGVRQQDVELLAGDLSRHKRVRIHAPTQLPKIPDITFPDKFPQN